MKKENILQIDNMDAPSVNNDFPMHDIKREGTENLNRPKSISQKAKDVFHKYQQQAIDFSRRNRLLKYPAKATKIEFDLALDECEEHFGKIQELAVTFPHKKILDSEKKQEKLLKEKDEEELFNSRTTIIGKKLISTLDKLRLQAKKNFDEHGLNTLFLVVGEIKWKEQTVGRGSTDATKVQDYSAPLLLIPIELENTKEPYKATNLSINIDQDPVRVNPVLLSFIKQTLGLRTPNLPEDLLAISYSEIRNIFSDLKKIFKDKGITIETSERVYIGQFSFHGQQIFEDLHKNEKKIIQHPFVYGVCSGDSFDAKSNESIKIDEDYNTDDFLNAEEDFTILDADSSQILAIKKIVQGEHMVIHGPPGTGKSQTIANVISNLLAREKTVLFVCEKQVALDVVYKRLTVKDHASVADLCLPLFRYASDKKRFAADIIDSRNSLIREIRADRNYDLSKIITERRKKLDFLKEYAEEIIKKIEPLEKNLYWIFGQLAKISEKSKELSISWKDKESPIKLSVKDIINHKQALKGLNPFISLLEEKSSSWNGLKRRHFSPDFTARTTDVLKEMKEHLSISPYNNDKVKYLSIEKAMDFSQKVTDDNFLNLFDTELLNLKKIGHKYLEELVKKIQLISQNSLKYQTTNRNSEFEFAEYWEIVKELKNSFTNEKISLEAIYANQFAQTVGWLADSTKKLSSGIPNSILDLSVKDFESIAFLFGIDPLLTSIVYKSKTDLYDLLNQLKQFESLHNQLQSCHEILDKYGVNFSLISKEEVLRLEDLFIKKYKTFFRIFSTSYRREKADIISWCGLIKPESHSEVKNICFAVATRLKLSAKLDDEWQKVEKNFKLSSEARKLPLHYFTTIIESVVSYLTRTSLEFIEPYLQKIILDEKKSAIMGIKAQVILKVIFEYKKVRSFLNFDIFDQKIYDLEHTFKTLSEEVSLTKSLAEKVEKFKHYHKEITVQDVQEDVIILNKLKEIVSDTKKLDYLEIIRSDIKTILVDVEFLPKVLEFSNILLKISRDISETNFDDLKNVISSIRNDKVNVNSWNDKFRKLLSELSNLFENEDLGEIYLSYSLNSISDLLSSLIKDQEGLKLWIEYQKQRHLIEELGLGWFILELAHKIGNGEYEVDEVYYWVLLNKWLEDYTRTKPILRDFSKQKYQKIIEEFKKLEIESLEINKKRILRKSLVNLESSKNHGGDAEKVLKREAEKKRQHIPIRTLVREYASHLQTIKPCWMVSPLALSSYLEYGKVSFDVVIFDEASQMRIENSLGAISRAKQVVVIGDEHQLPPTPFFGFSLEDDDDDDEDDGVAEETGFESILQRSISLLNGSEEYLKYHYRSASEDLIAFSNHYIYKKFGRQLITFPNAIKRIDQGVHFEFVKDGLYEGGRDGTRTNPKEAERVANLCIRLSEENNGSLGVIAFSKSQEKAIRNALEEKIKSYPHLAEKLDETSPEKESFFIKNLESVQGDERDRIILSVCYGPDKLTGKVRNHFGPINQSNGYRRLNVAVTRAKKQLICVTSMRAYDMHPPEGSFGAKLLQKYLEYAEKGRSALEASTIVEDNTDVEADSEFELSVEAELSRRGYIVHRQVGASGFKIDLAIVNPKNNNEYILGIECDGASYHSTKSARMRDRIRQDILEKLGWRIYRIWSQHWFEHKNDVIEDIVSYCNSIK